MARATILIETLTAIANAIRSKLGTTRQYSPSEMAEAIESIGGGTDVSDTTALVGDVIKGKKFHIASGELKEGSLVINSITPTSSTTPPSVAAGANYKPTAAGKLVGIYQELTPEDIRLYLPMFSDVAYRFPDGGIAIIKHADVAINPNKDVKYGEEIFGKGWNYMATPGYAYPSQVKGKSGTFTTSSTGITIDCGFKPTKVLIFSNPSSAGTYMHCDIYWDGTTCYIRTGGNKSACATGTDQTITPTSNGFTHKVMQTGASGYTAYYIAMP